MSNAAAFAIARAKLAALVIVPQPLTSHEHAEKMVREDALKILDELERNLNDQYTPDYVLPLEDYEYTN